jgi:hypothetical protein
MKHSHYTNLATQICRSNHLSSNFKQNQRKNLKKKIEHLDYYLYNKGSEAA